MGWGYGWQMVSAVEGGKLGTRELQRVSAKLAKLGAKDSNSPDSCANEHSILGAS